MSQRLPLDVSLAAGAVSSPWWLAYLHDGLAVILVSCGILLAGLRIVLAWRELRRKKR